MTLPTKRLKGACKVLKSSGVSNICGANSIFVAVTILTAIACFMIFLCAELVSLINAFYLAWLALS